MIHIWLLVTMWIATGMHGQSAGSVVYYEVPREVTEVVAFEWRDGAVPSVTAVTSERNGQSAVLRGLRGQVVVVMFKRKDGAYLIDGPFSPPPTSAHRLIDPRWKRTDRGEMPAGVPVGATVEWIRGDALAGPWPRCVRDDRAWECWGVDAANRGVLISAGRGRLWSVVTTPMAVGELRETAWGRLVMVADESIGTGLRVTFAHPVPPSSERLAGLRLDTAPIAAARAAVLRPGAVWVAGEGVPPKAWMEVRTARGGPSFLALQEVADGPAALPLHLRLSERRLVTGAVLNSGGQPAGGALVTLFRAIDPPAPAGSPLKPRRVLAAETIAGSDGAFQFDDVGEAEYEIVAWHSQLGKATTLLGSGQSEVAVRLTSPGTIRGRVTAAGRPLSGVTIVSVPDPGAFNEARDVTDVKGGDATSGPDGRFTIVAAVAGGGELRVGGGARAVRRIPLPRPPVPSLDLGDLDLGAPIEVTAVLDRETDCLVQAIGPVGRTGLQMVTGARRPDGAYRVQLPEPGTWQFGLSCGAERRRLTPDSVQIGTSSAPELRFVVR